MNKIAIYTCVTGNYDELGQPCPAPEGFDFIQFVAKGSGHGEYNGVWKIEELPESWDDPLFASRFPKLCPHSVLEGYEFSLWVDGNVRIADPAVYERCMDLAKRGIQYAGIRHPERDCAYEECELVLKGGRESFGRLMHIVHFLHKNGLPKHAGLMENNVIFRRHNDRYVKEFDRLWMDRFVEHSPRRDQLIHTLCLRDVPGMKTGLLMPKGLTARNSSLFEYRKHPQKEDVKLPFLKRKFKCWCLDVKRWILHLYIISLR